MGNKKTFAVKNKKIALSLSQQGFELLNVTKNKYDGSPCFIFEDTEDFRKAFNQIVDGLPNKSVTLTNDEKKYLISLLTLHQIGLSDTGKYQNLVSVSKADPKTGDAKVLKDLMENIGSHPPQISNSILNMVNKTGWVNSGCIGNGYRQ